MYSGIQLAHYYVPAFYESANAIGKAFAGFIKIRLKIV